MRQPRDLILCKSQILELRDDRGERIFNPTQPGFPCLLRNPSYPLQKALAEWILLNRIATD
jgi:hypothetical protein